MRSLLKPSGTLIARFSSTEDNAVVYASATGQTHLLDSAAADVLDSMPNQIATSEQAIINAFSADASAEQKTLLTSYITDIINSLLALEIISYTE